MKNLSLFSLAAALFVTAAFCSCSKDDKQTDAFDHFEIDYRIETNLDCRNCFNSTYEILFNDTVESSGDVAINLDGHYSNSDAGPNTTITFRTVPEFKETIPAELDFMLKFDITVIALGNEGEVLDSQFIRENRTYDGKIDLSTPEKQKAALDDYTVNFQVKSTFNNGKLSFKECQ